MSNPIPNVPLRTPMFDGDMKALGNLSRLWTEFFGNGEGWGSQGTHADRLSANPGGGPDAGFFIETDRGAIYQSRFVGMAQAWVLVVGILSGLLAARPNDLGANDVGFLYSSTDALDYRWNGTAWATLDTARGGGSLVDVGRLTKVTAAGVIGESSVTDDGTTVSVPEPLHLDTGVTPADAQVALRANLLGSLSLLCYAADNIQIGLDLEEIAGVNTCADVVVARILKNNGLLYFEGAGGQTVGTGVGTGGNPAIASYMIIDLSTGDVGFGGNDTPAYPVDVTGDANVSGVYRVDGTQVVSNRGAALTAAGAAVASSAGGTYPGTAQGAINDVIALANNLRTRVLELESRLGAAAGHGLIA